MEDGGGDSGLSIELMDDPPALALKRQIHAVRTWLPWVGHGFVLWAWFKLSRELRTLKAILYNVISVFSSLRVMSEATVPI